MFSIYLFSESEHTEGTGTVLHQERARRKIRGGGGGLFIDKKKPKFMLSNHPRQ